MQTIPCETDEPNTGLLEFYIFYGYYFGDTVGQILIDTFNNHKCKPSTKIFQFSK